MPKIICCSWANGWYIGSLALWQANRYNILTLILSLSPGSATSPQPPAATEPAKNGSGQDGNQVDLSKVDKRAFFSKNCAVSKCTLFTCMKNAAKNTTEYSSRADMTVTSDNSVRCVLSALPMNCNQCSVCYEHHQLGHTVPPRKYQENCIRSKCSTAGTAQDGDKSFHLDINLHLVFWVHVFTVWKPISANVKVIIRSNFLELKTNYLKMKTQSLDYKNMYKYIIRSILKMCIGLCVVYTYEQKHQ